MSDPASFTTARGPLPDNEQKQAALSYLNEAWAEARHDGIDGDCLAQASLFAAFGSGYTDSYAVPLTFPKELARRPPATC